MAFDRASLPSLYLGGASWPTSNRTATTVPVGWSCGAGRRSTPVCSGLYQMNTMKWRSTKEHRCGGQREYGRKALGKAEALPLRQFDSPAESRQKEPAARQVGQYRPTTDPEQGDPSSAVAPRQGADGAGASRPEHAGRDAPVA